MANLVFFSDAMLDCEQQLTAANEKSARSAEKLKNIAVKVSPTDPKHMKSVN